MRAQLVVAALTVLVAAGCTTASGGTSSSTPAPRPAPSTPGPSMPGPSTTGPTTDPTSAAPSSSGSPTVTASIAQPPDPVVEAGNAGAWTLTRAAPGAADARQLAAVQCGQDGSVTAAGLQLSAGARTLTLDDPAVTVTGSAANDAAGGTFRGRNADTAVTFTWTC